MKKDYKHFQRVMDNISTSINQLNYELENLDFEVDLIGEFNSRFNSIKNGNFLRRIVDTNLDKRWIKLQSNLNQIALYVTQNLAKVISQKIFKLKTDNHIVNTSTITEVVEDKKKSVKIVVFSTEKTSAVYLPLFSPQKEPIKVFHQIIKNRDKHKGLFGKGRVIPAVVSLHFGNDEVVKYAGELGIYALQIQGTFIKVLNYGRVKKIFR